MAALQVPDPAPATSGDARAVEPVRDRRAVAVAASAMELLRPRSDLARLLESFAEVDLLLAADDVAAGGSAPLGRIAPPDHDGDPDGPAGDPPGGMRSRVADLGLADLQVHRLALPPARVAGAEADLVAALSELVGFDPGPGLYCLAPAPDPSDPGRSAIDRAARRIAQVYGVPLLRYRCLELSVAETG